MESVIPWNLLTRTIKRAYPQGHTGRPPVALEVLLCIYFLQQWYGLSDPAAEDSLYDTESMRRFVGVELSGIPFVSLPKRITGFTGLIRLKIGKIPDKARKLKKIKWQS